MLFAGYQTSYGNDYPGGKKITGVLFVKGCNMDCYFCHNRMTALEGSDCIPEDKVKNILERRKGLLDGVVISGGEPTIYGEELIRFIEDIRKQFPMFLIKLDTNGTNPDLLKKIIFDKMIDFVSMDIKAPIAAYSKIKGCEKAHLLSLRSSIRIIQNSNIGYQFRTTLVPELSESDIAQIQMDIGYDANYILQPYRDIQLPVA